MVTKAFKSFIAIALCGGYSANACDKVKKADGSFVYISPSYSGAFPATGINTVNTSSSPSAGIWIGSGNTAYSDSDYTLANKISSGFSASTPTATLSVDSNDNPILAFSFTITNTGSSDITINEIGYFQNLKGSTTKGATSTGTHLVMIDRTVLDSPIVIPAGEYAAVKYSLKSVIPDSIRW